MPWSVRIENQTHKVPDGPHLIQTVEHDIQKMVQVRREYQFNLPTPEVRVKTWEIGTGGWWGKDDASQTEPPNLVDDRIVDINEFLVKDSLDFMAEEYKKNYKAKFGSKEYEKWATDQYTTAKENSKKWSHTLARKKKLSLKRTERTVFDIPMATNPPEAEMERPELVTGTRVKIPDPLGQGRWAYGTVIELKATPSRYEGKLLICMDKPHDESPQAADSKCGKGYGHFVEPKGIKTIVTFGTSVFKGMPEHIGVTTSGGFKHDGVTFPPYSVGRVLCMSEGPERSGEMATVAWLNLPGMKKNMWQSNDGEKVYEHCFNVPSHLLRWCWLNPISFKVRSTFYTTFSEFKEGDYLVYRGDRAMSVPMLRLGGEEERDKDPYFVTKGVVFQHVGWDQSHQSINGIIAGGMPKETWGRKLSLRKIDVRPLDDTYLPPGQEVEVVAEIVFKKKNLQGRIGRVILPTDEDGDVGVEFPEDIGAGSLDGAGKQGRCLYVPAATLKETSG